MIAATVAAFELIVRGESCLKAEGNMRKLETVSLGPRFGVGRQEHTQALSRARIGWPLLSSTTAFGPFHCTDLSVSAVASTWATMVVPFSEAPLGLMAAPSTAEEADKIISIEQ